MLNKTIMKNIRVSILATVSAVIFLATALGLLISILVLQQYDGIYVHGQTQGIVGGQQHQITDAASSNKLSLLKLTSQGSPYQGSISAPVTVIDFSDLQCHLCA